MKWIMLASGLVASGVIAVVVRAWRHRHDVSPDWLIDHERRCWGSGVDQPSMAWPINKIRNEHAGFNTQRLRKHG
jgi:hypothetical protein